MKASKYEEFVNTYVPRGIWGLVVFFGAMVVLPVVVVGCFVLPPRTFDRWFGS
jgi:hypothetical protein